MRPIPVISSIVALSAFGVSTSAVAQEAPKIFAGSNGEIEATYSNNCVVYYNANGSRKEANSNCSKGQRSRADEAVASYRREQGGEAPPGGFRNPEETGSEAPPGGFGYSSSHNDVPEIIVDSDGRLQVNVGTRCSIYYKKHGNFDRSTGVCSSDDRRAADRAVEGYRREQGDDVKNRDASRSGYYNGVPIYRYKNGSFQATMTDGCIISFNSGGVITSSTKSCTLTQKSNATVAVIQFKKDHDLD